MIVAPRFVFLHLHKSGGTFVNEVLLRHVPGARQHGYHLPRTLVPNEAASLPAIGSVRSPWAYYVSWFEFQRARPTPNPLFRVLTEDGSLNFAATLRRMLSLDEDAALLARVVQALPPVYTQRGLNLPGPVLAAIAGSGRGFYSWLHDYLYSGAGAPVRIARMETLRGDIARLLEEVGEPMTPALSAALASTPPRNVGAHAPIVDYYDDALAALVARKDASVIDAYGYSR
ncbi:MAG: hypothetical protein ABW136_00265 [Steroidobacteraceae bacterium]